MTQAVQQSPAPPGQAPPNGGDAKAVIMKPFRVGVQEIDEDVYDESVTLAAGTRSFPQYNIPSTAFLRAVYLLATVDVDGASTATATGTGAVGVLLPDGPYSVIDNFQFTDTNGSEIYGPIGGWDLYAITKWGGYLFQDDPEANTDIFSSTSNATASSEDAGNFMFLLRIPVEIVPRDALGSLPNKSASTPFKIKIRAAAIDSVYVNAATVGGTFRIQMMPDSYWEPTGTDGSGNTVLSLPPGVNTTQYWNVTPYDINTTFSELLINSVGFPVRNLLFVTRDSDGDRFEDMFPEVFKLQLQTNLIINRLREVWRSKITGWYGYTSAGDGAGQKDNGLYAQPYCHEFTGKPGNETRRGYLRTTDGMRMQAKGEAGSSGQLVVYTNTVAVGQGTTLGQLTT